MMTTSSTLEAPRSRLLRVENLEITSEGSNYTLTLMGGLRADKALMRAFGDIPEITEVIENDPRSISFVLDDEHTPKGNVIPAADVSTLKSVIDAIKALIARRKA